MTERETIRCPHCKLVQFLTEANTCRRCKKTLVETPPAEVEQFAEVIPMPARRLFVREPADVVSVNLKRLRLAKGWAQRRLAEAMGVPRSYISKLENGKAVPTLGSLNKLSAALGVPVVALIDATAGEKTEIAVVYADPFLRDVAKLVGGFTPAEKNSVLEYARALLVRSGHSLQQTRRLA